MAATKKVGFDCTGHYGSANSYLRVSRHPYKQSNRVNNHFFTDDKRTVLDVRYKGCYRDGFVSDFETMIPVKREYLGVRSCTGECHLKGYPFAAIQDAKFCMCSRQYGRYGVAEDENACMTQCIAGSENEKCGGPWKNAVYEIGELIT